MKTTFREGFDKLVKAVVFCDAERVKEICSSEWLADNRADAKYRVCHDSGLDSGRTNLLDIANAWKHLLSSKILDKLTLPISSSDLKSLREKTEATQRALEEVFPSKVCAQETGEFVMPIQLKYGGVYNYRYDVSDRHIDPLLVHAFSTKDFTFFNTLLEAGANPWAIYKNTGKNLWQIILYDLNEQLNVVFKELLRGDDLRLKKFVPDLIQANTTRCFYDILTECYPDTEDKSSLIPIHPRIVFIISDAFRFNHSTIEITYDRTTKDISVMQTPASSNMVSGEELEWIFEKATLEELQYAEIQETEVLIMDGDTYELLVIDDQGRFAHIECDEVEISQIRAMQKLKDLIPKPGKE